jgi:hypothetical protein
MTFLSRRETKKARNISSLSLHSANPAFRALIVLDTLSKPLLKMKSAKFHDTRFS